MNPLISAERVAELLGGISRQAVYDLVSSGDLVAVRVGKRRMAFREEDVQAFVERRRMDRRPRAVRVAR